MELACPKCGKIRTYRPATVARLKTHVCRTCLSEEAKAKWVTKTCPHCGTGRQYAPWAADQFSEYCPGCPRYKPGRTLPDNFDGGYVLGVMLGDGTMVKGQCGTGTGYGLKLAVTSKAFAMKFQEHLSNLIGRKPWYFVQEFDSKGSPEIQMPAQHCVRHVVGVWSREWYDILFPFKKDRIFDGILGKSEEFRRGFFQGMLDSEGYVSPSGYIDIANKDMNLLWLVRDVLASLGYRSSIYGPYSYSRGVAHLRTTNDFQKTA